MIDLLKMSRKLPAKMQLPALSKALEVLIPFNLGLGIKIKKLNGRLVELESPDRRRRRNHLKGAHACFLALLGEYPAGLIIAQKYSFENFRLIISHLEMEYFKQGHGKLKSVAKAPKKWPKFNNGEARLKLLTDIFNDKGELIAQCKTHWQVKEWSKVRKKI